MGAGTESKSAASTSSSSAASAAVSPCGKRARDHEDDVYVDNLNSHKRYLSEIMASSLNGLTVGDHLSENIMYSPGRPESTMLHLRDEMSVQYSPMSEDSDDSRYLEGSANTCSSQPESAPTSPVSPHRSQKPLGGYGLGPSSSSFLHSNVISPASSPQPRQRGSDTEGRFPSSPSDICHSADLRRAALLRSVQMRAQPSGPSQYELHGVESGDQEVEEQTCSCMKLDVDDGGYQMAECALVISESEDEKSCGILDDNFKGDDESGGD